MNQLSTNTAVIKVGVVDDLPLLTTPFADKLNQRNGIQVTLVATSGQQLLQDLKEASEKPDIILMDVLMPDMNGIETTRRVTALYPDIKIVALTVKVKEHYILQMLTAGAWCLFAKVNTVR